MIRNCFLDSGLMDDLSICGISGRLAAHRDVCLLLAQSLPSLPSGSKAASAAAGALDSGRPTASRSQPHSPFPLSQPLLPSLIGFADSLLSAIHIPFGNRLYPNEHKLAARKQGFRSPCCFSVKISVFQKKLVDSPRSMLPLKS